MSAFDEGSRDPACAPPEDPFGDAAREAFDAARNELALTKLGSFRETLLAKAEAEMGRDPNTARTPTRVETRGRVKTRGREWLETHGGLPPSLPPWPLMENVACVLGSCTKAMRWVVWLLVGACAVLKEARCALIGGHSCEGAELSLGFAITGAAPHRVMTKGGLAKGQALVLTKALGTGGLFAAHLRAQGEEFRAALTPADRRLLRASKIALILCIFLPSAWHENLD